MVAFHSLTCNLDHTCPEGRSHLEQSTGKAKRSGPAKSKAEHSKRATTCERPLITGPKGGSKAEHIIRVSVVPYVNPPHL